MILITGFVAHSFLQGKPMILITGFVAHSFLQGKPMILITVIRTGSNDCDVVSLNQTAE